MQGILEMLTLVQKSHLLRSPMVYSLLPHQEPATVPWAKSQNAVNLLTPRVSEIYFTSVTDSAPLNTFLHKGLNNLKPSILVYNPNKMHKSQSLFYLTTALHVSGVTITHLQEHKTTVTTASGNRYTVTDRVRFTDKEYR